MKKKLLSLLMAGAVVAGTTMPAYAQNYQAAESQTIDANVTVTGTVDNADGIAPAGKIQVEVPTTLSFTVDKDGQFDAAKYTISNKSQSTIQVLVGSFKESKISGGITLVQHGQSLKGQDRSHVQLALRGNEGYVDLADVTSKANSPISIIAGGDTDNIQLLGAAGDTATPGTGVDKDGASEDFELVFKIKKHS